MTEFQELVKDAPKFVSMERGELVAHAYAMYASGVKMDAENAKLRELVRDLWLTGSLCDAIPDMRLQAKGGDWRTMQERVDEALGIEVTE